MLNYKDHKDNNQFTRHLELRPILKMNGNTTSTSKNPLKVLLLGDEGCGKTSLLKTYIGKNFDEVNPLINFVACFVNGRVGIVQVFSLAPFASWLGSLTTFLTF